MRYGDMSTVDICKIDGVKDLTLKQRMYFAKALKAEDEGRDQEAMEFLKKAVEV